MRLSAAEVVSGCNGGGSCGSGSALYGLRRKSRACDDKCRSYKPTGLTPRAGKVKAGEGERGGKTWSEQATAQVSEGYEQQKGAPEGAHLKM